jgi:hypothetical protein
MNDNEPSVEQRVAQLTGIVQKMRVDLKKAQVESRGRPKDEKLARQVEALRYLMNGVVERIERLRKQMR